MTDVLSARAGRLRVAHAEGPPLAGVSLPVKSHLSLVTSLDGLADLERDWQSLEGSGLKPHGVFQTFDWVRSWARFHLAGPDEAELSVIAGYREEQLVFIWPLMKVSYGPVKVLRWLSEPLSQYGDILLAPGECPKAWGAAALSLIKRLRNIDVIRLRHVRADATIQPFLAETFRDANYIEKAPWLDLSQFASDAAYEARYSSSQRKRRKKIRKSLEEEFGPVTFEMLEPGSGNDTAMREAIAEKCQWLETRGRHNRILGSPKALDFLKHLSRARDASVRLVTSRMSAGGKPLSWEIGLRFGERHFGFITSHVTALTDYSPARLHMDFSQRQALADGMKVFDLMVPYDPHKESWSSAAVETRDYQLPVTPKGQVYGRLYLETLRPLARNIYYRLPPGVLRLLKPVTGH